MNSWVTYFLTTAAAAELIATAQLLLVGAGSPDALARWGEFRARVSDGRRAEFRTTAVPGERPLQGTSWEVRAGAAQLVDPSVS